MINAEEQRVIDIAEGSFEYKGDLYTVRSTYLKTLKLKLDEDEMELTNEQATQVIQTMYGNIERGVKEGYLKKLSDEKAKEVREKGEARELSELGVTGEERQSNANGKISKKEEDKQEKQEKETETVTTPNGKTYPVQHTPLELDNLDTLRTAEIETLRTQTSNEDVASQLNASTTHMIVSLAACWLLSIVVVTCFLKIVKHRKKAFLTMLGASIMALSLLVAGTVYVFNSRAYSADTWETIAVDSGYFKECTKAVKEDLQKVFTGVKMESGVEILGLEDNAVYRDAKIVFEARLAGKDLPKLEARRKKIQQVLRSILPGETYESVNAITNTLMERYRKLLDTPYASYLHNSSKGSSSRNLILYIICSFVFLLAMLLVWKGGRFVHRKFRATSFGIGMAGASFLAASVIHLLTAEKLQIEPAGYQALFDQYLHWVDMMGIYLGALLLFGSAFAWVASFVLKKNFKEKNGLK